MAAGDGPRRLASLLGGDLHVSDRPDGARGVRFRLRIPLRLPPASPPQPLQQPLQPLQRGTPRLALRVSDVAVAPAPRASLASALLLKRRVLVVDDGDGNRRLARRMLLQLGCLVIEASDGDRGRGARRGARRG